MPTYEGGNPVSAPDVGGNMPLVAVYLGRQSKSVKCNALTLKWPSDLVILGDISQ